MGQAKSRGTREQRIAEAQKGEQQFNSTDGLQRYVGFNRLRSEGELPSDMPEDALVCMVSNIVAANHEAVCQQSGLKFQIGNWFVSAGKHESTVVRGPFSKLDEAFDFASVNFNAVRFVALDYE